MPTALTWAKKWYAWPPNAATYFVANMKDIPVADGAFDMVTELFAPFNERELARVLAPEGSLYTVVPGARHLFGLKEVLYDTPYLNDEKLPKTTELELVGTQRVSANITLRTQADIEAVFQMTPYYYRTRPADKERLANLDTLQTDTDFIIAEYRHRLQPAKKGHAKKGQVYFGRFYLGKRKGPTALLRDRPFLAA